MSKTAENICRQQELSFDAPAREQTDSEIIDAFRNFLAMRFGDHVVRVLDHRLEDDADTKDLVGTAPGLESAYKVKKAVNDLKTAIRMWAGNDPELTQRIEWFVAADLRTLTAGSGGWRGRQGRGEGKEPATFKDK